MKKTVELFYKKCPLNKWTFKIKTIRDFIEFNCHGLVLNLFAGLTKLNVNEIRNDSSNERLSDYNKDALNFILEWNGEKFDTIILDPPYSYRKSMEMYNGKKNSRFKIVKDNISKILNPNGIVITMGYNSVNMGINRGFKLIKLCIFSHGGAIHDTLCSIEQKKNL